GGVCIVANEGAGFEPLFYKPSQPVAELKDDQPRTANDAFRKGQKVFETYCQLCHQSTGLGAPNQSPPLAGSEWVLAKEPGRVIRIVLHGLQGPVRVKSQAFDSCSTTLW